jgi:cytidylate kinase
MSVKTPCHIVIAIDGPSGVGKSTVARRLARRLGFCYVDSGAIYRAVGWAVQAQGVAVDDRQAIAPLLEHLAIDVTLRHGLSEVWLQGQNVTCALRGEAVGKAASAVATMPAVREMVTAKLRGLRCRADVVMEGRDIGTAVFPDATLKFFLEASPAVRGERRFREMQRAGQTMTLEQVTQSVAARDAQDRGRALAPLTVATEAQIIDTTNLTVDEVIQIMLPGIQKKIPQRNS